MLHCSFFGGSSFLGLHRNNKTRDKVLNHDHCGAYTIGAMSTFSFYCSANVFRSAALLKIIITVNDGKRLHLAVSIKAINKEEVCL